MPSLDQHGNPMTGDADAVDRYDRAIDRLLRFHPEPSIDGRPSSSSTHPQAPMAHALIAYLHLMSTDAPDVATARDACDGAGQPADATSASRPTHDAIGAWLGGDWDGRQRRASTTCSSAGPPTCWRCMFGHQLDFFLGDAQNLRDRPGRSLPRARPRPPARPRSCAAWQAFGLEESGHYGAAERPGWPPSTPTPTTCGRSTPSPTSYEMQGRVDEGIRFLSTRRDDWGAGNLFTRPQLVAPGALPARGRATSTRRSRSTTPRSTTATPPACRSRCSTPARCCGGCYLDGHDTGGRFEPARRRVGDPRPATDRGTCSTTCTRRWRSSAPGGSARPSSTSATWRATCTATAPARTSR